jgi:hypothetical protein
MHRGVFHAYYQVKEVNLKRLLYDSNYMTFWKSKNHRDSKKTNGLQGLRGERDEQSKHRDV